MMTSHLSRKLKAKQSVHSWQVKRKASWFGAVWWHATTSQQGYRNSPRRMRRCGRIPGQPASSVLPCLMSRGPAQAHGSQGSRPARSRYRARLRQAGCCDGLWWRTCAEGQVGRTMSAHTCNRKRIGTSWAVKAFGHPSRSGSRPPASSMATVAPDMYWISSSWWCR